LSGIEQYGVAVASVKYQLCEHCVVTGGTWGKDDKKQNTLGPLAKAFSRRYTDTENHKLCTSGLHLAWPDALAIKLSQLSPLSGVAVPAYQAT
jgi:hypothetical protein